MILRAKSENIVFFDWVSQTYTQRRIPIRIEESQISPLIAIAIQIGLLIKVDDLDLWDKREYYYEDSFFNLTGFRQFFKLSNTNLWPSVLDQVSEYPNNVEIGSTYLISPNPNILLGSVKNHIAIYLGNNNWQNVKIPAGSQVLVLSTNQTFIIPEDTVETTTVYIDSNGDLIYNDLQFPGLDLELLPDGNLFATGSGSGYLEIIDTDLIETIMAKNLGNVTALIKSTTAPTKKYVVWAHIVDPLQPDDVILKSWDYASAQWLPLKQSGTLDSITFQTQVGLENYTIPQLQGRSIVFMIWGAIVLRAPEHYTFNTGNGLIIFPSGSVGEVETITVIFK